MSTYKLRPWTDIVRLHPDVEEGRLTEAIFAIDLGAIAEGDPNIAVVNREPREFFSATYPTADLRKLLEEVLTSLAGKGDFNRVLKLRTPFGGGKSHTLAFLLHAARARKELDVIPEAKGLPDPGKVQVAVFDGEKFDAHDGKTLPNGKVIRTMWGWLAWQLGEDKFKLVEGHDRDRISPGGDKIKELLAGGPKLFLLDEVLKYMERTSAVKVEDSTLGRQALDFFHNLTVEISRSKDSVLVYSLQWSGREAMGNTPLLETLDKLAGRVDQLREPVTGDEILPVIQRRLFKEAPPKEAAQAVAEAYTKPVSGMLRADAESPTAKRDAEEKVLNLKKRIEKAYPFHPALIDIMKERWCSVDAFQRTRGALSFLATCLHSLKKSGEAKPLLGPTDIPLHHADVRVKMLKELGVQNAYDAALEADLTGPNARAKRIDDELSKEVPELGGVKPATRLATAIFTYSFGGLKREAKDEGDALPPGVTQKELLETCVDPDLEHIRAKGVLSDLRNSCLYLHFDDVRYCFKKEPTVTKLIEDAEQEISKHLEEVREKIKSMLCDRLKTHSEALIWPENSHDLPDEDPRFILGYMPLEFTIKPQKEQESFAIKVLTSFGNKPRKYRNGLGLVIPDKKHLESLRRAVRYLIAIESLEAKKNQFKLSKDQLDDLRERQRTETSAADSAFRDLYNIVWLPTVENGEIGIETLSQGARPLQEKGIHERVMELLKGAAGVPRIYETLKPNKVIERLKLGESLSEGEPKKWGIPTSDILDSFFSVLEPPRLVSSTAVKEAIAEGVARGVIGYTSGAIPELGSDTKFKVNPALVHFNQRISADEIDFDSGFVMLPQAIPQSEETPEVSQSQTTEDTGQPSEARELGEVREEQPDRRHEVRIKFSVTRNQLYKAYDAFANLADKSDEGKITVSIEGKSEQGYDPNWLRNAVEEPLGEADIEVEE